MSFLSLLLLWIYILFQKSFILIFNDFKNGLEIIKIIWKIWENKAISLLLLKFQKVLVHYL